MHVKENSNKNQIMDNRKIAFSAFSMSVVTFISRVFGLLREWLRGYLLGTTGSSDAFTIAFMFPNLLRRLVGEGAMTAAFVPVFSDYVFKKSRDELEEFVKSFFTLLFTFLLIIVLLALFGAPILRYLLPRFAQDPQKITLTIFLTRLMFPYIMFISIAALIQAILNTYGVFVPSATTPILLNVSIIGIGLAASTRIEPALAMSIGVVVGGVLQLLFPLPFMISKGVRFGFRFDLKNPGVRRVFFLMLPGIVGAGVYQINVLVSEFIAATLEEGSVAALRFSNVLVELVLGVFIISISTVILPALSEKAGKGDRKGMIENLSFALRLVFIITLPATVGLAILRYPIVRMLFRYGQFTEQSAGMVTYALIFHALGLCGTGGTRVVVQMFYSMKDTRSPVYVGAVVMAANLALCYILSGPLRLGGIALAGSIAAYINFFALVFILKKRVGGVVRGDVFVCFIKSLVSSIGMGLALYIFVEIFRELMAGNRLYNAVLTISAIVGGIILYFVLNLALKNRDILKLLKLILKKLGLRQ